MSSSEVLTMILGGGVGSRLFPLTKKRAKPAVPVGGQYRLIDVPISNSVNSDMNKVYVLTQYNSTSLNKHVVHSYQNHVSQNGFVEILAANQTKQNQEWFQGTADAIRQYNWILKEHIERDKIKNVLILSGDHLYRMDYRPFLEHHVETESDITIATQYIPASEAYKYGVIKERNYKVIDFYEKPDDLSMFDSNQALKASMGVYIFNAKVLYNVLENEYTDSNDFGNQIIPSMIKNGKKVTTYNFDGYWEDIGTIKSFFEANMMLVDKNTKFSFFDVAFPIYTRNRNLAPSKVLNTKINNCIICDGSYIKESEIQNTVIGLRSVIGQNCIINRCVLMGNDLPYDANCEHDDQCSSPMIGSNSQLNNCIIDKNVTIGKNVKLINMNKYENYEDPYNDDIVIKDGIIVIAKNALIPDDYVL
jgi:glucose-1-phosphate adenylyltransferase